MLKKIISTYFKNIIFSFINEETKLKLIKYNKNLQNYMNIDLNNYILFSKRYLLYRTKTEGKEYDWKGRLIFEGEYLKGKRNGKEYNEDEKLIYEGEYLNGQKNGYGKEFYLNGLLKFEGEFLNGKKWNGIGYGYDDYKNKTVFNLKNGNGLVKEFDEFGGKQIFIGEYLNGEKNGKGEDLKENI